MAKGLGLDLDMNLYKVFAENFDLDIEFDPMHPDRAFWRKWNSLGGTSMVRDLEESGCSFGR